jgi:hypothetical protein
VTRLDGHPRIVYSIYGPPGEAHERRDASCLAILDPRRVPALPAECWYGRCGPLGLTAKSRRGAMLQALGLAEERGLTNGESRMILNPAVGSRLVTDIAL